MIKEDFYRYKQGLSLAKFDHPRIQYAITKTKRLVDSEIKDLEESIKPSEEFNAYLKEREEVAKSHCKKDDKGELILKSVPSGPNGEVGQVYDVDLSPKSKYVKDLEKLNGKYSVTLEKRKVQLEQFNELLKEETEFTPHPINLSLLEEQWKSLSTEEREKRFPDNLIEQLGFMILE